MGDTTMPTLTQETLFGEPEIERGTVTIPNDKLYPFLRVVNSIADECKLDVSPGELSVRVVDSANVGLVDVTLQYDHGLPEFTEGLNVKALHNLLATKPRDADVDLTFSHPYGQLRVESGDWTITERVGFLDPSVIRERPDIPDLDHPVSIDVDVQTLASYLSASVRDGDFEFRTRDGCLQVAERHSDGDYTAVAETDVDASEDVTSIYSDRYISNIFTTLRSINGVDTVTMNLRDEFPTTVEFSTDEMSGFYMIAPRIRHD